MVPSATCAGRRLLFFGPMASAQPEPRIGELPMTVTFCFVPPSGGEAEYSLAFDLPSIPRAGDYVLTTRPDNPAVTEDFIVKRTWWRLMHPASGTREEAGIRQAGSVRENAALQAAYLTTTSPTLPPTVAAIELVRCERFPVQATNHGAPWPN